MIKKIAQFAVCRPASMIVLVATIIILGFLNLAKLPIDLLPQMDLPVAAVITTYTGAGPEEVEEQVTKMMEGVIGSVSGIDTINSTSSSGSSTVVIMFDYGTNMDSAMISIRDQVALVDSRLPDGVSKPMIVKMDPNMMPVIQLTIDSDLSLADLQQLAEDEIEPQLLRIPEVSSVTITGGREKEVKVEVDPVKAENYGLTLSQITSYLRSENYNTSSGSVSYGERDYFVRSLQEFESLDDIGEVAIVTGTGNKIFLKDIAEISEGYKDVKQITRTGGKYAVGIHCQKETDANTVDACTAVKKEIEKIKSELAVDLEVEVVMDQSEYIQSSINATARTMGVGAIFAVLVILLFLRNIRSTMVVFTAIPLSIIATFILLFYTGSTLNIITLGGLALGIGRMVDDSIVVFENIYRHRTLGLSPYEAALKGTTEVGGAVLATTLTLMAVFIPIGMTEGIAGILFKPMALTLCLAILCSLLVALTIVPFLSSRMLTDEAMEKRN